MNPDVVQRLVEINRQFYDQFGEAFAETRRRIQAGVRRAASSLPDREGGSWLDLGCGSGALAVEWLRYKRRSAYLGLDFSGPLLQEAARVVAGLTGADRIHFAPADLSAGDWSAGLSGPFDGALCFAVLHHMPSDALRARLVRQVGGLLAPGGRMVVSVWQFHHSPKLAARVLPWETVGLSEDQLEPGDTLLDWRHMLPAQAGRVGLRYVHRFTPESLADLGARAGFSLVDQFESDGQSGNLGLYQVWRKDLMLI